MRFWDIPSQISVCMARGSARANSVHPACSLFGQLFACTINLKSGRNLPWLQVIRWENLRLLPTAGAFTFSDGLRMVAKRGEIMSQVSGGGMAAVIALEASRN